MKTTYFIFLLGMFSCTKDSPEIPPNSTNQSQIEKIYLGKELILHTSKYFGPNGTISQSSNGMNCTNCHLEAGTVNLGNSYKAVFANYPKFRERSGSMETLEKRINDCFQRSLNGDSLKAGSKELQSMVAYINSVGENVPKNTTPKGSGIAELKFLDRAASPEKGKIVYTQNCTQCHGENGAGLRNPENSDSYFLYPPLWGNQSYNVSAGMNRIQKLAGFIYANMPNQSATYEKPVLTIEQSWDVAAYIISQPRPQKFFKGDWPKISTKPIDYAFGPFADKFSENQHRYGPFQPIVDARKKN